MHCVLSTIPPPDDGTMADDMMPEWKDNMPLGVPKQCLHNMLHILVI